MGHSTCNKQGVFRPSLIKLGVCINYIYQLNLCVLCPRAPKISVFSRNGWKVLKIGRLECVSYGVVCAVFYCVDSEKTMINEDECQECELRKLVVETRLRQFWNVLFFLIYAHHSDYFRHFMGLFIKRLIS